MRVACLLLCLVLLSFFFNTLGVSQNNQNSGGLPRGRETDTFFNRAQDRKQKLAPAAPSQEDSISLADLNRDGKCDRQDINVFRKILGKCVRVGSSPVVSEVDFDLDGCITQKDKHAFLDLWQSCRDSKKGAK